MLTYTLKARPLLRQFKLLRRLRPSVLSIFLFFFLEFLCSRLQGASRFVVKKLAAVVCKLFTVKMPIFLETEHIIQ